MKLQNWKRTGLALLIGMTLGGVNLAQAGGMSQQNQTTYHYQMVDGVKIFYREAGNPKSPTIVLWHGFPSSSHMYRMLIPLLADKFHVVAPDYPGMGYSDAPDANTFNPTFEHLADVMADFLMAVNVKKATFYMQDFGGPVGFRIAVKHPDWISGLVVQNANAYNEGLAPMVIEGNKKRAEKPATIEELSKFELDTKLALMLYKTGAANPDGMNPDAWTHCEWAMNQPGHKEIGAAYLNNYQTNIDSYPQWHEYLKKYQPHTLVVWGKGDPIFLVPGAEAFKQDLKKVEIHLLDTSHFATEEQSPTISKYIHAFMAKK